VTAAIRWRYDMNERTSVERAMRARMEGACDNAKRVRELEQANMDVSGWGMSGHGTRSSMRVCLSESMTCHAKTREPALV